jgi:hypothetical protein
MSGWPSRRHQNASNTIALFGANWELSAKVQSFRCQLGKLAKQDKIPTRVWPVKQVGLASEKKCT